MADNFEYDVFLSHSTKDKAVVGSLAERLRDDGLKVWFDEWEVKPGDSIPAKIEEGLERSRVLVLCMSANAFGADWAQLEAGTFRFRDPLNKERRFIPLRLDDAPIKGSLAQFLYITCHPDDREGEYQRLLEACRDPTRGEGKTKLLRGSHEEKVIQIDCKRGTVLTYKFAADGKLILSATSDGDLRLWEGEAGPYRSLLRAQRHQIRCIDWNPAQGRILVCGDDHACLLDATTGEVIVDYGKSLLSKRHMDCFRLLAGGVTAIQMERELGLHRVTISTHLQQLKVRLKVATRDDIRNLASRFYGRGRDANFPPIRAHHSWVPYLAWSIEKDRALSGDIRDRKKPRFRLCARSGTVWDTHLMGPVPEAWSIAWTEDRGKAVCGYKDGVLRLWEVNQGKCLRIFEGHSRAVSHIALNSDQRLLLSGSADQSVRLWDIQSGGCLRVLKGHSADVVTVAWSGDGRHAFSGDSKGGIRAWDLSELVNEVQAATTIMPGFPLAPEDVQYTNAKVLLVGESGVGKTGLSNYLARGIKIEEEKPLPSTDGAWATHWPLKHDRNKAGVEQEIWLWDFAGQVDYRLVHQVFMDDASVAVLVFNPQNTNPFDGLGHWDHDLQKAARKPFAKLLAAARVDRGGLVVSAASMRRFMKQRGFLGPLHVTSAKTGEGCDQLRKAIVKAINWKSIPETTSPALYHRLKQEILALRDRGLILIRLAELKQRMEMTLRDTSFELAELEAVVGLLAGPGMIQPLDFGGFILLRPEVLSRYAAAVVRKVRKHPQELGCIREDELLAGVLDYQDFKRLEGEDEAVVLRTLLETFISRSWCLRQPCDGPALLVFPSYFRRERTDQPGHPSVLVTYRFDGPGDDIYAALVVRLHHTVAFQSTDLWNSAADFKTQTGQKLGFTLTRESEGTSLLEVYFEPDVDGNSRVLFLRYVHDHLMQHAQNVVRLRRYFCGNKKCDSSGKPFAEQAMIDKAVGPGGKGKVFCPDCGKQILLRDVIEQKFESPAVKAESRKQDAEAQVVLDNESRELILVGHSFSIVAEAGQIYRGYTNSDHGIDGEIEFKDDRGRASGKRLYVQLKSGDSYLSKRQRDGAEVFQIKNPRWADYWQQQAYAVMLVIRTSDGEIRWMDVSAYLKRESVGGKAVKQIVFAGERFDAVSVQNWRRKALLK